MSEESNKCGFCGGQLEPLGTAANICLDCKALWVKGQAEPIFPKQVEKGRGGHYEQ